MKWFMYLLVICSSPSLFAKNIATIDNPYMTKKTKHLSKHPHYARLLAPAPGILQDTASPFSTVGNGLLYTSTVDASGNILAAGQFNDAWQVVSYNPDGSRNTSFGGAGNGVVSDTGVGSGISRARDMIIDHSGRILVVGEATNPATGNPVIAIARYHADGTLQQSLLETGLVDYTALGVAIRDVSTEFIIGGYTLIDGVLFPVYIAYYDDMTRNPSYGPDGIHIFTIYPSYIGTSITWDPPIAEVELAFVDPFLLFPSLGVLQDNASPFNTGSAASIFGGIIDAQENLVLCGSYNDFFTVVRYTTTGERDTTFGTNGVVQIADFSPACAYSIIEDGYGNYYVAGESTVQGIKVLTLVQYDHNGALVSSFGHQGIAQYNYLKGESRAYDLSFSSVFPDNSGSLTVVGQATQGSMLEPASFVYDFKGNLLSVFGHQGAKTYPEFGSGSLRTLVTNDDLTFDAAGQLGDKATLLQVDYTASPALTTILSGL